MNKLVIASLIALSLLGAAYAKGRGTTATSSASMSGMSMSGQMAMNVNVNTATVADLQKIPGVSAKIAADIVKNRPYKNQAELVKKVKGIGPKNVLKMAAYLSY